MAEVEVQPFIMRNAVVTLGEPGDDFAKAVSSAALTPSSGTTDFKGLKPDATFTFPQATTWTLDLTFAQDWSSESSLSRWLFDHIGEIVPFTLDPDDSTTKGHTQWTGTAAIVAGAVGGDVDAVATATSSLGVIGQPTPSFVAATP